MDVKLGRRVWDDFAEQDKIDYEKKYPNSGDYWVLDHWNEGICESCNGMGTFSWIIEYECILE